MSTPSTPTQRSPQLDPNYRPSETRCDRCCGAGSVGLAAMIVELTTGRVSSAPAWPCWPLGAAVILVGGLRELTAQTVEDGAPQPAFSNRRCQPPSPSYGPETQQSAVVFTVSGNTKANGRESASSRLSRIAAASTVCSRPEDGSLTPHRRTGDLGEQHPVRVPPNRSASPPAIGPAPR